MGRGAWQATVHGVEKSQPWLSNWHFISGQHNNLYNYLTENQQGYERSEQHKQQDLIPTYNPVIVEYTLFFKWEEYVYQDINKLYLGP